MPKTFNNMTDAEFLSWNEHCAARLTSEPTDYFVTPAQALQLTTLTATFKATLDYWTNRMTRTPVACVDKIAARAALMIVTRFLVATITNNPLTTDSIREQLDITPRKKPTSRSAPTTAPGMHIKSVNGWTVEVGVHDSVMPKRKKALNATAAWVYSYVGPTYPSDPSGWSFQGSTSNGHLQFTLPDTVPGGSQVWICAAWINAKQEAGPISSPLATRIQGGGVSVENAMKIAA